MDTKIDTKKTRNFDIIVGIILLALSVVAMDLVCSYSNGLTVGMKILIFVGILLIAIIIKVLLQLAIKKIPSLRKHFEVKTEE